MCSVCGEESFGTGRILIFCIEVLILWKGDISGVLSNFYTICQQAQTTYAKRMEYGLFWLGYPLLPIRIKIILGEISLLVLRTLFVSTGPNMGAIITLDTIMRYVCRCELAAR